jgi:AcrR family transcriptional regulator
MESQRQKQKNLTRKHIIDVSIMQFAKNGLTTTRTADIAKAANVSHGTIFAHFSTQEELLSAVIEEFGLRIILRLHELVSSDGRVREVLEAHLKGISEFEGFYTRLVIEGRLLPESSRNTFVIIQSAISFHFIQAAEREMDEGRVRKMPVHLLFNTWVGLVHYYLSNSDLFVPEGKVLERHGQELLTHFLKMITP